MKCEGPLPLLLTVVAAAAGVVGVQLQDGVYHDLVVGVKKDTAEPDNAQQFMDELSEFLQAGSEAIYEASGGRASIGSVRLVIPRPWEAGRFAATLSPAPPVALEDVDVLLYHEPTALPTTLQAELCGVPGRQVLLPLHFLTLSKEQEVLYGAKGLVFAHHWAQYRYGVRDEHGFEGDPVYGAAYGQDTVTGCTKGPLPGVWRETCPDGNSCMAGEAGCHYCITGATAAHTQASLGYLPALSTGQFCDGTSHNRLSPSPQNLLCGRRSITEVISAHPDTRSITRHKLSSVEVWLQEEPLGRIMFLLDTPFVGGEYLSYSGLLDAARAPIASHGGLKVGMTSFRANEDGEVQLYRRRDFATISPSDAYNLLYVYLPAETPRSTTPDLGKVITELLRTMDEYQPGTLLVIPVTNELLTASKLQQDIGHLLRRRRVKPLLLFPHNPFLSAAGAFLQSAGARFYGSNVESEVLETAQAELWAFVSNTFMNDHPIVRVFSTPQSSGSSFNQTLLYQPAVCQHRLAVVTTTGPLQDLQVLVSREGVMVPCAEAGLCTVTEDSVLVMETTSMTDGQVSEWTLGVRNIGADAQVGVTWSQVNFVGVPEELVVRVWSSEGRGPVAYISENAILVLYVSVWNGETQVLRSRVTVTAQVAVTAPNGTDRETVRKVALLDDGQAADIRRDDSIYSYGFSSNLYLEEGTVITVLSLVIDSHSYSPVNTSSKAASGQRDTRSSRLLTLDPAAAVVCCGSYVEDPDVAPEHDIRGYYLHLQDVFDPIVITRTIDPGAYPTTVFSTKPTEDPQRTDAADTSTTDDAIVTRAPRLLLPIAAAALTVIMS